MLRDLKGQAALEYSVLIAVVIAALVAMQIYMKHSYEGRLRSSIDEVGKQSDVMGLQIDITSNSTSESIEVGKDGHTYMYMGYNETGSTAGDVGDEQVTVLTENSNEVVPSYNVHDPLF